jgi:hypothetical protein
MNDLDKFVGMTKSPDLTEYFTIEQYADKSGVTKKRAEGILENAVERGTLIKLKANDDGKIKRFYKLKSNGK